MGAAAPWPMGKDSASLFAGIRRSSLRSLLEDSGETSFSNRNASFRFDEEEPPSDTEFSQYYGSAETERATCAPTRPAGGDGTGGTNSTGERRIRRSPENCPLRRGRKQDEGFSHCGATPFLLAEKNRGKETARGDLFRGGPPWTPSPTAKGAPPPLDSPLLDEGRRTKDGRRRTRDEKLYTGKAAIILKLTTLPQPPASMAEGQFVYCENNHAIKKSFCPFNRQPL